MPASRKRPPESLVPGSSAAAPERIAKKARRRVGRLRHRKSAFVDPRSGVKASDKPATAQHLSEDVTRLLAAAIKAADLYPPGSVKDVLVLFSTDGAPGLVYASKNGTLASWVRDAAPDIHAVMQAHDTAREDDVVRDLLETLHRDVTLPPGFPGSFCGVSRDDGGKLLGRWLCKILGVTRISLPDEDAVNTFKARVSFPDGVDLSGKALGRVWRDTFWKHQDFARGLYAKVVDMVRNEARAVAKQHEKPRGGGASLLTRLREDLQSQIDDLKRGGVPAPVVPVLPAPPEPANATAVDQVDHPFIRSMYSDFCRRQGIPDPVAPLGDLDITMLQLELSRRPDETFVACYDSLRARRAIPPLSPGFQPTEALWERAESRLPIGSSRRPVQGPPSPFSPPRAAPRSPPAPRPARQRTTSGAHVAAEILTALGRQRRAADAWNVVDLLEARHNSDNWEFLVQWDPVEGHAWQPSWEPEKNLHMHNTYLASRVTALKRAHALLSMTSRP